MSMLSLRNVREFDVLFYEFLEIEAENNIILRNFYETLKVVNERQCIKNDLMF